MIGFYDYTIILTFLSLVSSVFGMTQAVEGHFKIAIACLAFSGLCDAFDGKVARTKKDRSRDQQSFGIQLDSLCDMVGFGAFPAMICYLLGVRGYAGCIAISYYCICSVIRLSFYNTLEIKNMDNTEEKSGAKIYYGLPITSIAVILPVIFLLAFVMPAKIFPLALMVMLFVVGTCYILNFKFKKPSMPMLIVIMAIVAASIAVIFIFSKYSIDIASVLRLNGGKV